MLCQRLGTWEHRFVLQLLGPSVREFVRQGCETAAHLVLQNNLSQELSRATAPAAWTGGVRPQDIRAVPSRPEAALSALLEVASLCLGPSLEGLPSSTMVEDVCVSLVMAPEYEALAARHARQLEKAAAG